MNSKRWLCLAVMSCLVLLSSASMFGQATANASLQGTITDKSQAVIGNKAEVTLTNKETGATKTTTTNDTGGYRFDSLSAGMYSIKATAPGFSTAEAKDVELLVGRTATQNFTLSPGGVSETVEVTSAAPLVDQTKTDVSTNITPEQITELPLIGRDIADLAYLAPGVKAADSYDPTKNRYSILSVNGEGGRNVNVTVNGVDNKDNTVGGPVMQLPAEAVQEFQVSTQRFSAVNGRSAGAAINVITKSGSNNFHGSAFGFFRDQALNADQKLANGDGTTSTGQSALLAPVVWRIHRRTDQEGQAVRLFRSSNGNANTLPLLKHLIAFRQLSLVTTWAHSRLQRFRRRSSRTASTGALITPSTRSTPPISRSPPRPTTA